MSHISGTPRSRLRESPVSQLESDSPVTRSRSKSKKRRIIYFSSSIISGKEIPSRSSSSSSIAAVKPKSIQCSHPNCLFMAATSNRKCSSICGKCSYHCNHHFSLKGQRVETLKKVIASIKIEKGVTSNRKRKISEKQKKRKDKKFDKDSAILKGDEKKPEVFSSINRYKAKNANRRTVSNRFDVLIKSSHQKYNVEEDDENGEDDDDENGKDGFDITNTLSEAELDELSKIQLLKKAKTVKKNKEPKKSKSELLKRMNLKKEIEFNLLCIPYGFLVDAALNSLNDKTKHNIVISGESNFKTGKFQATPITSSQISVDVNGRHFSINTLNKSSLEFDNLIAHAVKLICIANNSLEDPKKIHIVLAFGFVMTDDKRVVNLIKTISNIVELNFNIQAKAHISFVYSHLSHEDLPINIVQAHAILNLNQIRSSTSYSTSFNHFQDFFNDGQEYKKNNSTIHDYIKDECSKSQIKLSFVQLNIQHDQAYLRQLYDIAIKGNHNIKKIDIPVANDSAIISESMIAYYRIFGTDEKPQHELVLFSLDPNQQPSDELLLNAISKIPYVDIGMRMHFENLIAHYYNSFTARISNNLVSKALLHNNKSVDKVQVLYTESMITTKTLNGAASK